MWQINGPNALCSFHDRQIICLTISFRTNVTFCDTFFIWNLIFFRFMVKRIYGPIKENKDDFENFDGPQYTQKIDTSYFASHKTSHTTILYYTYVSLNT